MFKFLKVFYFIFFINLSFVAFSQTEQHTSWSFSTSKKEVVIGEEIDLIFKVKVDADWYMYSTDFDPNLGPTVTAFTFKPNAAYQLVGKIKPIGSKKKFDDTWGGDITYFVHDAQFTQKVKILSKINAIDGSVEYQECSDVAGKCIPHEIDFSFSGINVKANSQGTVTLPQVIKDSLPDTKSLAIRNDILKSSQDSLVSSGDETSVRLDKSVSEYNKKIIDSSESSSGDKSETFLAFMLGAFIAGLLALLTPCVYPMIPMTVTFFSTHSHSRKSSVAKAIVYGLSIIIIYTVIGLLVSIIFGPDALNYASTHWITNIIFFIIFVIFALSFFGLFEITLPSSFVNKVDAQADKGGYYGVFFMAFTIVLVSFSCTGPIVASILLAAAQGELLKPAIGMFGFSLAFALPFTLFAIFPGLLHNLPKSGGWLNSVKVVLGFIELALAFKFLSVADQVYHWGILDRDIFIIIWIAIFALSGLYLLGKFKLPHDSETPHIGITRMLISLTTFCFVIYLIPGLFGAPLKGLAGLLPPMSTHDFNLVALIKGESLVEERNTNCESPKYGDLLHLPHGIEGYFDFDQAASCARKLQKPIFIDFTGHGCTNCREMEANVWADPKVLKMLKEDFVVLALYVDERKELPKGEWYTSDYDGKIKTTIGKKNFDIEKNFFWSNAQPYYCLVDHTGKLLTKPQGYDLNVDKFLNFMQEGDKNFKKM